MGIDLLSAGVFAATDKITVVDALLLAVIGIAIVFILLAVLMVIVALVGKIFDGSEKLQAQHPEWADKINNVKQKMMFWKKSAPADPVAQTAAQPLAEGTCGELKLINTDERDAAMIMAIVADSTGTPLNELRFKSIKKVEDEEK